MLKPAKIDSIFDLAIDSLTCFWGGLIAPKICEAELKAKLAQFPTLISFASSFSEDSHLSKENYFNICSSKDKTKLVGNNVCCMVAVFAFESLKEYQHYQEIKKEEAIKFLRHLRNAGAHGNSFNFKDSSENIIDPGQVKWKDKIITKKLQDKTAFPDFFAQGDFAYLFEDISKLMKNHDT